MKTERIYVILATFLMLFGMAACNDNKDRELKPTSTTRTITLISEGQTTSDNGNDLAIRFTDLDAGAKEFTVEVKSNTLWKIEISSNGGWCSVDMNRGQGDGSFKIMLLNNRNKDQRSCVVSVCQIDKDGNEYMVDGMPDNKANIEITQAGSEIYMNPSSIDILPAEKPEVKEFEIVANTEWTLSVRPENAATGDFITIHPIEGMTANADDGGQTFEGVGNAKFSISLTNNASPLIRRAYIELKSANGNTSVEISQQKSDSFFNVSPNTTQEMRAEGDSVTFSVYSPSYDWDIVISDDAKEWLECPVTHYAKSESMVSVKMVAGANISKRERKATIFFQSEYTAYGTVPVEIIQNGFDLTFDVGRNDLPGVVPLERETYRINVSSMFDWQVAETPGWITVTPSSGKQSDNTVTLEVTVERNVVDMQRNGIIKIIPLKSRFSGIEIEPEDVNISPAVIDVLQYGGQQPAVSAPWLRYEAEQKQMTLSFNYYSPYKEVTGAGLKWRKVGDGSWNDEKVAISDPASGTLTVTLDGLEAVTKYEAYGYVVAEGKEYPGSLTETFITAGKFPDSSDNPVPN